MPITATDILFKFSGGAGNSDPNASLGGAMSTTQITSATLHNLFDVVTGAESSAGDTEYRGFYVQNNHGSLTWLAPTVWIESEAASGASAAIALAGEAVNVAMETIANESTAPVGESFTSPTTKGTGLVIADIPPGQFKGIWIRRTVPTSTGAQAADNAQIRVEGDTNA